MAEVGPLVGPLVAVLVLGGAASHRRRASVRRAFPLRLASERPTGGGVGGADGAGRASRARRGGGRAPGRPSAPRWRRPAVVDATGSLPDVVDLLAVAASSGLPAGATIAAVAPRAPEPWRSALGACVARADGGELVADAIGHLPAVLGDAARPVVAVLRAGLADGDRLAADLRRLAVDARDLRRRRAEERARRIPVRLLLPLVTCSLPAFAVLSIVPIVAGALDGLRFPSVPP